MNLANMGHMHKFILIAGVLFIISTSSLIVEAQAQGQSGSTQTKLGQIQQPKKITVVETLYGINDTTGKVVFFANVGDTTEGIVLDATLADQQDKNKDGILEVGLTFSNVTVKTGDKFRACTMVLNTLETSCAIGHKSARDRAEYIDFVINDNNSTTYHTTLTTKKDKPS